MPIRALFLFPFFAFGVYGQTFSLKTLTVPTKDAAPGKLFIQTSGGPAPVAALVMNSKWEVTTTPAATIRLTDAPVWDGLTVTLSYDPAGLGALDPKKLTWAITFDRSGLNLQIGAGPAPADSQPKGKDDSDLYFFGSYLAGEGTAPIYSIDAKLSWVPEVRSSGYFFGAEAAISSNAGASPPASRTRLDPDSITADIALKFDKHHFLFNINPARGEFSRKTNTSDFVPAINVQRLLKSIRFNKRNQMVVYPSLGLETGVNLNKPATLFGQSVDLANYNAIVRIVPGGYAAYYIERPKPNPSDPYLFQLYVNYTDRVVLKPEPFVTTVYSGTKQVQSVSLGTNPRTYVEVGFNWNAAKLVAVTAKYKYGSLPPLFQFLDHQVTLGITFKTKLPKTAPF
jgi:hypothetical protein